MSLKSSFSARVWEIATAIPEGRVMTYGGIAKAAGGPPMASRSISSILGKAPNQKAIPWHRIVYAGGKVWFGEYEKERRRLLKKEGVSVNPKGYIEDFEDRVLETIEW